MKKFLILLVASVFLLLGTNAFSLPIKWDVSKAGSTGTTFDSDTLTGLFDQMGLLSQTSTIQYDTDGDGVVSAGDKFTDSGDLRVTDLIASTTIDKEGLSVLGGYEVTALWDNLEGEVTKVTNLGLGEFQIEVKYTSGDIDFYLDTDLDSAFVNPAATSPPAGAGGTGFGGDGGNSAVKIAELSLLTGKGFTFLNFDGNDIDNQGSVELSLEFTDYLPGFWLNEDGVDIFETVKEVNWVLVTTDQNIDTPTQNIGEPTGALYTAYSNQNGSADLNIVPEPTTMLLLGFGLLGLAGVGRRRA